MENKKRERITSLRRVIEKKKAKLGCNSEVLYFKGLKKYNNLAELKYPKSLSPYKYAYINDKKGRFNDVRYNKILDVNKHDYVFNKLVNEVSKKILLDFEEGMVGLSEDKVIEFVNKYIKDNTDLNNLSIEKADNEEEYKFAEFVIESYEKKTAEYVLKVNESGFISKANTVYTSINFVLSNKTHNRIFTGRGEYSGIKIAIHDLVTYIAKGMLVKIVGDHLEKNEESKLLIQKEISDLVEFNQDDFNLITSNFMTEALEDNHSFLLNFLKTTVVITMEKLLRDSFEIYEYTKRMETNSSGYAKTYMTKKNIPEKIQNFMNDNKFLTMFGYVEADELCDINKLEQISEELMDLSDKLYLPKVKDHSLRFRRLGKLKASGVYYPGFNSLVVDIDGASSFIHELMHLIDFENEILSLDEEFKPLLGLYIYLMDEKANYKAKNGSDEAKNFLNGKGKYNRAYYMSNEEAFARMGEIFVTEILKVETSLSKENYKGDLREIVYPLDKDLLDMIEVYYSKVFKRLEESFERVTRNDLKSSPKEIKNVLDRKVKETKVANYFEKDENKVASLEQISFF